MSAENGAAATIPATRGPQRRSKALTSTISSGAQASIVASVDEKDACSMTQR